MKDGKSAPKDQWLPRVVHGFARADVSKVNGLIATLLHRHQASHKLSTFAALGGTMNEGSGRIFISYRRSDSTKDARALYERLCREFGERRVFIDLEGIGPGEDFVYQLRRNLDGCEVLVALIGPGWSNAHSDGGARRLGNADDFVRVELRTALTRGIKVFPVLVDGAPPLRAEQLPEDLQPLVRRQAIALDYTRFEADVVRLVHAIRSESEPRGSGDLPQVHRSSSARPSLLQYALGALLVFGAAGAFGAARQSGSPNVGLQASPSVAPTVTEARTAKATLVALKAANVTNSVGDRKVLDWLDDPDRRYARLASGCLSVLDHARLSRDGADVDKINEFYSAAIGLKGEALMPPNHDIDMKKLAKAIVDAYNDKNGGSAATLSDATQ